MDTLQLQDVFEPYYAGKRPAPEQKLCGSDGRTVGIVPPILTTDRRARFDAINRRFGRTRRLPAKEG